MTLLDYAGDETVAFLREDELATAVLPKDTLLWRIHDKDCVIDSRPYAGSDEVPHEIIRWSTGGRFGSQDCPVLYLGKTRQGAFLETLCSDPALGIAVSEERLGAYACSSFELPMAMCLANLTADGLLKNRLDGNVFTMTNPDDAHRRTYRYARNVAAAIHENPNGYDGILYHSRVNPEFTNVALFYDNENQHRDLQQGIEVADRTLVEEQWVYRMQRNGFISIEILR